MENKGKKTTSLILGIVGAVFSIVSIPMYLLSLYKIKMPDLFALIDAEAKDLIINLKGMFSALSILKDVAADVEPTYAESDYFSLFVHIMSETAAPVIKAGITLVIVLVFVAMFFNLLTAVFGAIPGKGIKIGGVATGFIATIMPVVLMFVIKAQLKKAAAVELTAEIEAYGIDVKMAPGIGLILAIVFSALAMILVLVALILAPKKAPAMVDGYDQGMYDQGAAYDQGAQAYDQGGYGAAPQPAAQITFLSGSNAGYQIPIVPGQPIFIGKDPNQCSVVIDKKYAKVSRLHCSIDFDPNTGAYIVTDYSTNGTNVVGGSKLPRNTASYVEKGATINLAHTENAIRLD